MNHQVQWHQIQSALENGRLAQSMLFVGPLHCAINNFTVKILQLLMCKDKQHNNPCLNCIDCTMTESINHPDIKWIKPDKAGGAIKIDQIRELQQLAYLTPQRSLYKLIIIESAERMNTAAANALLKILEEPAKHTKFILIAQQLSTVLPTVLSRCQRMIFSSPDDLYNTNLLRLGELYALETPRALIMKRADLILDELIGLLKGREHPCILAASWGEFELANLLWFLYLVYSQVQWMHFNIPVKNGPAIKQLTTLLTLLNPILIFNQLDIITALLKKLSHNMNVNHTLALENLLFSLVPSI